MSSIFKEKRQTTIDIFQPSGTWQQPNFHRQSNQKRLQEYRSISQSLIYMSTKKSPVDYYFRFSKRIYELFAWRGPWLCKTAWQQLAEERNDFTQADFYERTLLHFRDLLSKCCLSKSFSYKWSYSKGTTLLQGRRRHYTGVAALSILSPHPSEV